MARFEGKDSEWARKQVKDEILREKVDALMESFFKIERIQRIVNSDDAIKIYQLLKAAENFKENLKNFNRPVPSDDLLVYVTVSKLDPVTSKDWKNFISEFRDPATFDQLKTFLKNHLKKLSSMFRSSGDKSTQQSMDMLEYVISSMESSMVLPVSSRNVFRYEQHLLDNNSTKAKRILLQTEQRKKNFFENILCEDQSEADSGSDTENSLENRYVPLQYKNQPSFLVRDTTLHESIILPTAVVKVITKDGQVVRVRALIEKLSPYSLISYRLADAIQPSLVPISSIDRHYRYYPEDATECTKIRVISCYNSTSFHVKVFLVQDKITLHKPRIVQSTTDWRHLSNLQLADDGSEDSFSNKDSIELVLGADACEKILQQRIIQTPRSDEPIAEKTSLGWILSGTYWIS